MLELLIVVALIGILVAIAYPSYKNSVVQGWRTEGRAALSALLMQQERYINQTGEYKTFGAGASTGGFTAYSGSSQASSAYLLGARACSGKTLRECVVVFAVPVAAKPDPEITEMVMDSIGSKTCTGAALSVCWP